MTDDRLDGWKAIANFLGRERTTALRWAKERGLPVHRVPGGRTGTVFALRTELEDWLASAPQQAAEPGPAAASQETEQLSAPARGGRVVPIALTLAAIIACGVAIAWWMLGRASALDQAPVSIATVAPSSANAETLGFARALTADLARFANASTELAVFEREPDARPDTQFAVRTAIERAQGGIVANVRLIAVPNGEVLWSRRFEQSHPAPSALRDQVAASIMGMLQCSFGTLEQERTKARNADIALVMAICQDIENGDLPSAQSRARQLTETRPDLAIGWAWLAVVQGNMLAENPALKAEALASAQRAQSIAPEKACTWLAQAAVAGRGLSSPEALPFIERGLRAHPDHTLLLSHRSIIAFNLGYVKESVEPALIVLRSNPSSLPGRDVAVRRLAAAGRLREALQIQAESEALWPAHPRTARTRAMLAHHNAAPGEKELQAMRESERDVATAPYLAYQIAYLHERKGNRKAALGWLARAPAKDAHQQWSVLFWPEAAGLRTEPAFFRKMAALGLVRWWIERGKWPDFCSEPGLKYSCVNEAAKLGFPSAIEPRPLAAAGRDRQRPA